MKTTPTTCEIPEVETGEICGKPLPQSRGGLWPCCLDHAEEWRAYAARSEEMHEKPLDPAAWAEWRKTGGVVQQGGLRLG